MDGNGVWRFPEGSGRQEMWKGIVGTSSVVPRRPPRLRDREMRGLSAALFHFIFFERNCGVLGLHCLPMSQHGTLCTDGLIRQFFYVSNSGIKIVWRLKEHGYHLESLGLYSHFIILLFNIATFNIVITNVIIMHT